MSTPESGQPNTSHLTEHAGQAATGHTPGPLHIAPLTRGFGVYSADGTSIAKVGGAYGVPTKRREADARLFAAAPDLLAAAQSVVAHMEGRQPIEGWLHDTDASRDALALLVAAITKATGSQP